MKITSLTSFSSESNPFESSVLTFQWLRTIVSILLKLVCRIMVCTAMLPSQHHRVLHVPYASIRRLSTMWRNMQAASWKETTVWKKDQFFAPLKFCHCYWSWRLNSASAWLKDGLHSRVLLPGWILRSFARRRAQLSRRHYIYQSPAYLGFGARRPSPELSY